MQQFFHNIAKKERLWWQHCNICWQMVSCWFMLLMLYLPLLDIFAQASMKHSLKSMGRLMTAQAHKMGGLPSAHNLMHWKLKHTHRSTLKFYEINKAHLLLHTNKQTMTYLKKHLEYHLANKNKEDMQLLWALKKKFERKMFTTQDMGCCSASYASKN